MAWLVLLVGVCALVESHIGGTQASPLTPQAGAEVVSDFEDLPILVPNVGNIDNTILKEVGAEKFLSLWYIFVLSGKVVVSDEPWTLFVPLNHGLPKDQSFLTDRELTREVLLNHVTLGDAIEVESAINANLPFYSLADSELFFTRDETFSYVNGIRLTGEVFRSNNGIIYVIDETIPLSQPEFLEFVPLIEEELASNPTAGEKELLNLVDQGHRDEAAPLIVEEFSENVESPFPPSDAEPLVSHQPTSLADFEPSSDSFHAPEPTSRPTRFDKFRNRASQSTSTTAAPPASKSANSPVPIREPTASPYASTFVAEKLFENLEVSPTDNIGDGATEYEEFGSGPPALNPDGSPVSFAESMFAELQKENSNGAEFLHHFRDANLDQFLSPDANYTALIPTNGAFYDYYPIDWGFNPFLVENFTKDVLLNHILEGNIHLQEFNDAVEIQTIEGKIIKVTKNTAGTLLVNGHVMPKESEIEIHGGRLYFIHELLFVDYNRVYELREEYPYLETAPLISFPWPSSPFLSHLLKKLQDNPRTKLFAQLLRNSDIAGLVSSSDENLNRLSYSAFVPTDEALKKSFKEENLAILERKSINDFLLEHIVPGYLFEEDFENGFNLLSLTNSAIPIKMTGDDIFIGPAKILKPQQYVYNLGAIFLIDQPFQEIRVKEPMNILEGNVGDDMAIIPLQNIQVESAHSQPEPSQAPPTTVHELPIVSLESLFPVTDNPQITYEVRTEISYSKQINDGLVIPVTKEVIERAKSL